MTSGGRRSAFAPSSFARSAREIDSTGGSGIVLQFAGGGILAALLVGQVGDAAEEERAVVPECVVATAAAQFGVEVGHILRQLLFCPWLEVPSRQWFLLRHGFSIRNLENNCKRGLTTALW